MCHGCDDDGEPCMIGLAGVHLIGVEKRDDVDVGRDILGAAG